MRQRSTLFKFRFFRPCSGFPFLKEIGRVYRKTPLKRPLRKNPGQKSVNSFSGRHDSFFSVPNAIAAPHQPQPNPSIAPNAPEICPEGLTRRPFWPIQIGTGRRAAHPPRASTRMEQGLEEQYETVPEEENGRDWCARMSADALGTDAVFSACGRPRASSNHVPEESKNHGQASP